MPRARSSTPPRPDGEGSSPDAHQSMNDDEHAQRRRQLLEDLKVLSSMGLNKELQLPQLVCIGSQSAGKSSLIETLCRITLPRSSGTCTRCPIECRSKYTDQPWMGRVFLRLESEGTGSADAAEIPFGDVMTDPGLMEKRIAQAQLAVLSPNTEPRSFLTVDPNKYKAAPGFTNSSVIVDISGDGQADLNFVDLPGLIVNVADGGEAGHIELVKDMIRGYIRKENSIILLVVSCHTDYETQGAGILAAEFDPKGERTVGVLTKPDRIESSEEAGPWISMIIGRSNRLANGWYCVKQPDSKQRKKNLTWDEARDLEREFYQTNEAWARIPPEHRGRLGSKNLAYQLGNVLSVALEKRFAEIRIDVDRLIREATTALRQFPEAPRIPPSEFIQDLLSKFFKDVRKQIVEGDASVGSEGVIQQLRLQGIDFREQLQEVAPVFFPKSGVDIRDITRPEFLHPSEQWIPASGGMQYSAEQVTSQCQGGILRETIDFGSFDPTRFFMAGVAKEWELHATVLLEAAYEVIHTKLSTLVMNHFSLYSHGGLLSQISDLADELLTQCKDRTEQQLKFLAEQEAYPRTFHNALFDERRRLYEGYYVNYGVEGATLITMARTRTLYEFAFRRFADMGPLTIDLHFVNRFGDLIGSHVISGMNLLRDEEELRELLKMSDPMLAQRDALVERVRRLRTARTKLSS